jgi:hypothetical protein
LGNLHQWQRETIIYFRELTGVDILELTMCFCDIVNMAINQLGGSCGDVVVTVVICY